MDVKEEYYFWLKEGAALRNLQDLQEALKRMAEDTFQHHVNETKNDFHNWVRDVHQDEKLAQELQKAATPTQALEAIQRRVQELQAPVLKKEIKKGAKREIKKVTAAVRKEKRGGNVKGHSQLNNAAKRRSKLMKRAESVKRNSTILLTKNVTLLPELPLPADQPKTKELLLTGAGLAAVAFLLITATSRVNPLSSITGGVVASTNSSSNGLSILGMAGLIVLGLILVKVAKEKRREKDG